MIAPPPSTHLRGPSYPCASCEGVAALQAVTSSSSLRMTRPVALGRAANTTWGGVEW